MTTNAMFYTLVEPLFYMALLLFFVKRPLLILQILKACLKSSALFILFGMKLWRFYKLPLVSRKTLDSIRETNPVIDALLDSSKSR